MKTGSKKNGKLVYKASLIVTQTVMPTHKHRKQFTVIPLQDSDLASENKHDNGFTIRPFSDMMNTAFKQFGIFGMIVKSYGHNCIRQFIHGKPEMYGCKLWAVLLHLQGW
jgi:hypothetical protein